MTDLPRILDQYTIMLPTISQLTLVPGEGDTPWYKLYKLCQSQGRRILQHTPAKSTPFLPPPSTLMCTLTKFWSMVINNQ